MIRIKTSGIVSQSLLVCTLTLRPCRLDTKLIKRRDWTSDHPQGEEEEYSWRVNLIKIFEILGILMPLTKTICYSCARRICQTPLTCDLYEPALLAQYCSAVKIKIFRLNENVWRITSDKSPATPLFMAWFDEHLSLPSHSTQSFSNRSWENLNICLLNLAKNAQTKKMNMFF